MQTSILTVRAFVFQFVGRGQSAHDSGGVAGDERIRRHVADDDRTCRDDGVLPDGDAADDRNAPADPDIVFNGDRKRVFLAGDTVLDVERMTGGVDADVRRDPHVVADAHVIAVKDDEVVVREKVLAHFDVETVVALERRQDVALLADLAENSGACTTLHSDNLNGENTIEDPDQIAPVRSLITDGLKDNTLTTVIGPKTFAVYKLTYSE